MVAKKKTSDDWGKCHEVYFTIGDGYEDSATVSSHFLLLSILVLLLYHQWRGRT